MAPLITPGPRYHLLGLLFVAVGVLGLHFVYQGRMARIAAGLDRGLAPGERDVRLDHAGHHAIYLEYRSRFEGGLFLTATDLGELRCELTSRADGRGIILHRHRARLSYSHDDRAGIVAYDLWVERPGMYRLRCGYPNGAAGPQVVIGIGEGIAGDLSARILLGFGLPAVSILVGLIEVWIVHRRRERSKRRVFGRFGG